MTFQCAGVGLIGCNGPLPGAAAGARGVSFDRAAALAAGTLCKPMPVSMTLFKGPGAGLGVGLGVAAMGTGASFYGQSAARASCPPQPAARASGAASKGTASAKAYRDFAAGVLAGVAVDVPLHPLDTVKTRFQAQGGLAQAGGLTGCWRGLTPVLLRSGPCSGIFFVTYQQAQHGLRHASPASAWPSLWQNALAGCVANVAECSVRVPCEVVKQEMQASGGAVSLVGTVRRVGSGGLRRFYLGSGATISRELAFAVVQMPVFEELKRSHPWRGDGSVGRQSLVGAACGGLAGGLAGFVTTPLDVAKTKIMLSPKDAGRRGVLQTMAALHAQGGVRALFRGSGLRTAHVGTSCALSFGAFQCAQLLLDKL